MFLFFFLLVMKRTGLFELLIVLLITERTCDYSQLGNCKGFCINLLCSWFRRVKHYSTHPLLVRERLTTLSSGKKTLLVRQGSRVSYQFVGIQSQWCEDLTCQVNLFPQVEWRMCWICLQRCTHYYIKPPQERSSSHSHAACSYCLSSRIIQISFWYYYKWWHVNMFTFPTVT